MSEPATRRVPVLIVGGGPVGLAAAAELGFQGISCELIDQDDGIVRTPKMTEVNVRTMELCRRWGIAERIHACPFPGDYPLDVVLCETLSRGEISRIERPARDLAPAQPHSPMVFQACSQMWFDPILGDYAASHRQTTIRRRTRLLSVEQDEDEVHALVENVDAGTRERITCRYFVASDGAGSTVRQQLGIRLAGDILGHTAHLHFIAPGLLDHFGRDPATFFHFLDEEGLWATMRIIDPGRSMWRVMILHLQDPGQAALMDRDDVLFRIFGRRVAVTWIDSYVWSRRSMVAETYASGRVFLVGDSAHQFSPTGAMGMNTGVADAVDVGWKLAAVLRGWGGPHLLSSYDRERRPVAIRNAAMTADFYREYTKFEGGLAPFLREANGNRSLADARLRQRFSETVGRNFRTLGAQLGYRYRSPIVCADDDSRFVETADDPNRYVPTNAPGGRAPHLWLSEHHSTLDLFSRVFTLLSRDDGADAARRLTDAAARRRIPFTNHAIPERAVDAGYETRFTLVRPDGHVAWRGDSLSHDPDRLLEAVTGRKDPVPIELGA